MLGVWVMTLSDVCPKSTSQELVCISKWVAYEVAVKLTVRDVYERWSVCSTLAWDGGTMKTFLLVVSLVAFCNSAGGS